MPRLFGVDIAGALNANMGPGLLSATLIKITEGERDPSNPAGGKALTATPYGCRGFLDQYEEGRFNRGATESGMSIIKEGERKALILGASLPAGIVPEPEDQLIIEDTQYLIVNVSRDPAGATYTMTVKGS